MGSQRMGAGFKGDLVLDAGALIALERGDQRVAVLLKGALELGLGVIVPATVLAQAWRGGPRAASIARLVDAGGIDSLNERRAKEVGLRLSLRGGSDIADAHVVCCAVEYSATIVSSDEDDIRSLSKPGERLTLIAV
jgi:hypothetical protein